MVRVGKPLRYLLPGVRVLMQDNVFSLDAGVESPEAAGGKVCTIHNEVTLIELTKADMGAREVEARDVSSVFLDQFRRGNDEYIYPPDGNGFVKHFREASRAEAGRSQEHLLSG